ncbi:hypothetical protein SAMN05192550_2805 [Flavobacterium glycines]|uniref:Uncharacterized protein n=1 Tax=Flavobacterium glycines TaxID=551990 RepID=A0A1G8WQL6_9FLAO|nr:hypothetical protein SAMN05192550_2805 [Flavobacterium glycines]
MTLIKFFSRIPFYKGYNINQKITFKSYAYESAKSK